MARPPDPTGDTHLLKTTAGPADMSLFDLSATVTTLAAVFAWINHRWLRLPTTIGLMVIALVGSGIMLGLGRLEVIDLAPLVEFVNDLDFDDALLKGMLGALLFAGALHVHVDDLRAQKLLIGALATVGVVLSTVLVGLGTWWLTALLGGPVPLAWCLVFGALISPTDPIAVGAILKKAGVPKRLQLSITGESLFNDGVGVVVFIVLLGIAAGGEELHALHIAELFAVEVLGGALFGAAIGFAVNRMLAQVDQYQVEILLTLAVTTGGYALANRWHLSGPLAMVVAGLMIGGSGRATAMSERTRQRLDDFWELVDEFLNAVLFVLIGIEVVIVELTGPAAVAGLLAIPLVLVVRAVSVGVPITLLRRVQPAPEGALAILTWSGLRGGISIALALALPASPYRSTLLTITYIVVCFSILVQGLTVESFVRRVLRPAGAT
jgi:CPA1 family monovalent cation:H+ antiporter